MKAEQEGAIKDMKAEQEKSCWRISSTRKTVN